MYLKSHPSLKMSVRGRHDKLKRSIDPRHACKVLSAVMVNVGLCVQGLHYVNEGPQRDAEANVFICMCVY